MMLGQLAQMFMLAVGMFLGQPHNPAVKLLVCTQSRGCCSGAAPDTKAVLCIYEVVLLLCYHAVCLLLWSYSCAD